MVLPQSLQVQTERKRDRAEGRSPGMPAGKEEGAPQMSLWSIGKGDFYHFCSWPMHAQGNLFGWIQDSERWFCREITVNCRTLGPELPELCREGTAGGRIISRVLEGSGLGVTRIPGFRTAALGLERVLEKYRKQDTGGWKEVLAGASAWSAPFLLCSETWVLLGILGSWVVLVFCFRSRS